MRSTINTIANVTTTVIANVQVRTVVAGIDALREFASLALRLYAAPLAGASLSNRAGRWQETGSKKPVHPGHMPCSDQSRHCRRDDSRCRRPQRSGCWRETV